MRDRINRTAGWLSLSDSTHPAAGINSNRGPGGSGRPGPSALRKVKAALEDPCTCAAATGVAVIAVGGATVTGLLATGKLRLAG